jgi:hypothetical protein
MMTVGLFGALILNVSAAWAANPTPTATPTAPGTTLSDVAGGIKLNKDAVEGQVGGIVISNENLSQIAGKGRVTEVTTTKTVKGRRDLSEVSGDGAGIQGEADDYAEKQAKKQYWQAQYQRQIEIVQSIRKQIDILDNEIPGLWRQFYTWDDPFYRDGVIKPKIDKAMADRQKLEVDLQAANAEISRIQQESRRDGAEPGWFRGFDKLPTPKPTHSVQPQ